MRRAVILLATWGGTGYSPVASGTVGTIAAIPLYLLLSRLSLPLYVLTVVTFIFLSCRIAGEAEEVFDEKDSGKIVIDEVAGFLVTMTGVSPSLVAIGAGFALFRLFDIIKIEPARYFDRCGKGGYGVVLDDVAAGCYALISLHLLLNLIS
ncbi:phosphatidylglycerophosphatase A [Geobacter sp. DSM 9736]|uniref:phosphatidylglycerophosphatase A family protein n=1 Tax=Geobacter sp. DSM 9736 TaxID=1277350 RepID=UPI000B50B3FE|nr:phosphatidylglycerophosphatase A [Geobacter sp. DSM 9736]SNB47211.1 phosphatidylglycerophosphatase [Geobacter sp. DSM 9736]